MFCRRWESWREKGGRRGRDSGHTRETNVQSQSSIGISSIAPGKSVDTKAIGAAKNTCQLELLQTGSCFARKERGRTARWFPNKCLSAFSPCDGRDCIRRRKKTIGNIGVVVFARKGRGRGRRAEGLTLCVQGSTTTRIWTG